MQAKAIAKYIRMTPRKVRLVVNVIRGKNVKDAEDLLRFIPKMASTPIDKVLKSAKANAVNNHDMIEDRLYVAHAFVDAGPTLTRLIPLARGTANIINKHTSHITT
ncbi:MAG: 50S ribosomal protein L22, partial [Deinococcus sp.]